MSSIIVKSDCVSVLEIEAYVQHWHFSAASANGTVGGNMGQASFGKLSFEFVAFIKYNFFRIALLESNAMKPSHNSIVHLLRCTGFSYHYWRGITAGFPFLNEGYFWTFLRVLSWRRVFGNWIYHHQENYYIWSNSG